MKKLLCTCLVSLVLALPATGHAADCFADYKAKRDNPLRLHYGVIALQSGCTRGAARAEITSRLAGTGWTLLNILSVFGPEGLAERKANAGAYFLRF